MNAANVATALLSQSKIVAVHLAPLGALQDTGWRILLHIFSGATLTKCDMSKVMEMSQPSLERYLRLLTESGYIEMADEYSYELTANTKMAVSSMLENMAQDFAF